MVDSFEDLEVYYEFLDELFYGTRQYMGTEILLVAI